MSGEGSEANIPRRSSQFRRPGPQPLQSSTPHYYSTPSPTSPPANIPHIASGSYQGPPPYLSPSLPYSQHGSYAGRYTHSSQQQLWPMGHSASAFQFPHGFHQAGVHVVPPDGILPPPMHAGFQPMMQPHSSVYQYQSHSTESGSSSMATFSNPGASSIYAHHQVDPSPPPHSPIMSQTPSGQSGTPSASYPATGYFHSLRYPSAPQYSYHQHSFPNPMYRSQYIPAPYAQRYIPSPEPDGQGTWWYLPSSGPLQSSRYEIGQHSYVGHYPVGFSPMGHPDVELSYGQVSGAPSLFPHSMPLSPQEEPFPIQHEQLPPSATSSSTPLVRSPSPQNSPDPGKSSNNETKQISDKPVIRRHYHPNPPAHRSEWVMWVGNVPSDASHDELWRFFNRPFSPSLQSRSQSDEALSSGMVSIFPMTRSNCAFINFGAEAHLHAAISRFDGQPLRINDPRCPRIVCRVRRKDDDLKAGVGAQRGVGMHTRWIKDQQEKAKKSHNASGSDMPTSSPDRVASLRSESQSSEDGTSLHPQTQGEQSSGSASGSYSSTNSSILRRYFPKRYFILKSLKQHDLDLSVETGLWATQRHNEGILDQAYRTSEDVFLIFGVNKSGEFYGYARMAGPVLHDKRQTFASQMSDPLSFVNSDMPFQTPTAPWESPVSSSPERERTTIISPSEHRLVDSSPSPVPEVSQHERSDNPSGGGYFPSAPAIMGPAHHKLTVPTPAIKYSFDSGIRTPQTGAAIHMHPVRSTTSAPNLSQSQQGIGGASLSEQEEPKTHLHPVAEESHYFRSWLRSKEDPSTVVDVAQVASPSDDGIKEVDNSPEPSARGVERRHGKGVEGDGNREEILGEHFKVEWLCTDRLPFHRTRHLRNLWNHDREVKVSRDGTELEPNVGQKLLNDWRMPSQQP